MHKLFCIIGRTGSGKSTITNQVAKNLNLKVLKSYTTRTMRPTETEDNADHIFISHDEVEQHRNEMVAYTERVGYCSFATVSQVAESDFYVINPEGYRELSHNLKGMDVDLIAIYVTTPYMEGIKRAKLRGDFESWKRNYVNENKEFTEFEHSGKVRYRVLNNGTIDEAVKKMTSIIEKELSDVRA